MNPIPLPADCSRDAAAALWSQLKSAPLGSATLDGSAVEKVGQAMLQVLLVAGGSAVLVAPSAALQAAVRLAELQGPLLGEQAA